jgi:hypothetical protein
MCTRSLIGQSIGLEIRDSLTGVSQLRLRCGFESRRVHFEIISHNIMLTGLY